MGINVDALKEKLAEKNMNIDQIAEAIKVNRATFYRKLKAGGVKFTIGEIQKMISALNLSDDEARIIFFTSKVA